MSADKKNRQPTHGESSRTEKIAAGLSALFLLYGLCAFASKGLPHITLKTIDPHLKTRLHPPEIDEGRCFYIDPDREKNIVFAAYPTGPLAEDFRLLSHFMSGRDRMVPLGTVPVLEHAPCGIIKDGLALTAKQAQSLMDHWIGAILNGSDMQQAQKTHRAKEGILRILVSRNNASPS